MEAKPRKVQRKSYGIFYKNNDAYHRYCTGGSYGVFTSFKNALEHYHEHYCVEQEEKGKKVLVPKRDDMIIVEFLETIFDLVR